MPSGVSEAQAVVIGGKVYIGGGRAEGGGYKVLEYTIQGGQWREIDTPVVWFGMAVVNSQLIITGDGIRMVGTPMRCGYWTVYLALGHSHSLQCLQLGGGPQQWATRGGCWWWGDMVRHVWRYWTLQPGSGTQQLHYLVMHPDPHSL